MTSCAEMDYVILLDIVIYGPSYSYPSCSISQPGYGDTFDSIYQKNWEGVDWVGLNLIDILLGFQIRRDSLLCES